MRKPGEGDQTCESSQRNQQEERSMVFIRSLVAHCFPDFILRHPEVVSYLVE
jgi:hypothetical protein